MLLYTYMGVALIAIISVSNAYRKSPKIVNGTPVNITQFPYQVALYTNGKFVCGGSILSQYYIITAGHCVIKKSGFSVRVGATNLIEDGTLVSVKEVIMHPKYKPPKQDYDMAMLELLEPLEYDESVQPIKINFDPIALEELVDITGYGNDKEGGKLTQQLNHIYLPTVANEECKTMYKKSAHKITENMFCAGYIDGTGDTCQGDSGGPVAMEGKLIGIVSWGFGCARIGYPGLYTSLPKMKDFIEDILSRHTESEPVEIE